MPPPRLVESDGAGSVVDVVVVLVESVGEVLKLGELGATWPASGRVGESEHAATASTRAQAIRDRRKFFMACFSGDRA